MMVQHGSIPINRSEGVTSSERYLKQLCDLTFLSLWSYPGVYRDQGRVEGKGDGKEVCDLLVVFENHIVIFSDKYCEFASSGNIEVDWPRWLKKTILKSAEQVCGAERWIRSFPGRLFLDRQCAVPFPILVPKLAEAVFHRVVVAHDGSRRCREYFKGGSGSFLLDSKLTDDEHLRKPFTVGQINSNKGYVHVFDDTSLDIVMKTLDTISDFIGYLTKKEHLMTGDVRVLAAGEEELLAEYVSKINADNQHDFLFPRRYDGVFLPEGGWEAFLRSQERKAQVTANQVSYFWDTLIEEFVGHVMNGTQHSSSHPEIREQEQSFRWMAREDRTRRRMLAKLLLGLVRKTPSDKQAVRVVRPSREGDPFYVFLLVPWLEAVAEEEYREGRRKLLLAYCKVLKLKFPEAHHIIGIATESGHDERYRSEDFLHLDSSYWPEELAAEARSLHRDLGIFTNTESFAGKEQEYPVQSANHGSTKRLTVSRNSNCPCESGKRYKRCCGTGLFRKHARRRGILSSSA